MLPTLISHERSLPITLRSRDLFSWLMVIDAGVLFAMGCVGLFVDFWQALWPMLFFGLCFVISLDLLRKSATYLRLDYGGFTLGSWHREYNVPWSAVSEFATVQMPNPHFLWVIRKRIVGWRYASTRASAPRRPLQSKTVKQKEVDRLLPRNFGGRPRALADLMNELRRAHEMTTHHLQTPVSNEIF